MYAEISNSTSEVGDTEEKEDKYFESSPVRVNPRKTKTVVTPDGTKMSLSNIYNQAAHQLNDFIYRFTNPFPYPPSATPKEYFFGFVFQMLTDGSGKSVYGVRELNVYTF